VAVIVNNTKNICANFSVLWFRHF